MTAEDMSEYLRRLPVFEGPLPEFDPTTAPSEPSACFAEWIAEAVAAGVREPHAMVLSTMGLDRIPSARVLLLKGLAEDNWQFAVHSTSSKGEELAADGVAAMTFYWSSQARQIRVRGRVEQASAAASAADFLARSPASRAEALLGMQSRTLDDYAAVDVAATAAVERITTEPGLVIPEWTLYNLRASEVEFWQGNPERRHVRVRYERGSKAWTTRLLWP